MKVVAFNGSPKKEGNTYHAIELVAGKLREENIEVEIIHVGNKVIRGCMACKNCFKTLDERCIFKDEVNDWIQKMKEADGIILGSPTHTAAIAGTMKCFLDRAFYVTGANNNMLRHKVGASVVVARRSGGVSAFNQLNNFLNYSEMMIPTSNYWNVIHGSKPGEVLQDIEGICIMETLGKNMATMLKQREETKLISEQNWFVKKKSTSFIR
jgi:multimeric flavodoxin WrbA